MKNRNILIAVDLQNDFIDGALGTKEAETIIPVAAERIRKAAADGEEIYATLDTHGADYAETQEGIRLPVPHCIRDTKGWELRPEIREALGDGILVEKPTFGSVRLPELIREKGEPDADTVIELLGLCTDICVVSNALLLKAAFPEARLRVNSACCAGVTPEKHRAALETMASCQVEIL